MSVITSVPEGKYTIDPTHSRVGFSVRHAMVSKVRGAFNTFEGSAVVAGGSAKIDVTIQVASIDTRNADRDGHLASPDFFDAGTFPTITFTSTSIEAKGDDKLTVVGDITIHGVTKSVTFDLEYNGTAVDPYNNTRVGFEGTATIDRKDFGLTYNAALETGGILIGENVNLELEISAILAK